MNTTEARDLISALADGQLQGEALQQALHLVGHDAQAREAWALYHLVGDALRSQDWVQAAAPQQFLVKFQQRFALEQPVIEREAAVVPAREQGPVSEPAARPAPAANEAVFRWRLLAGVASVAAAAGVAWALLPGLGSTPAVLADRTRLAEPSAQLATADAPGLMLRDRQLDELLAAHRQWGSASALQAPAGFLRNAAFEVPAR